MDQAERSDAADRGKDQLLETEFVGQLTRPVHQANGQSVEDEPNVELRVWNIRLHQTGKNKVIYIYI